MLISNLNLECCGVSLNSYVLPNCARWLPHKEWLNPSNYKCTTNNSGSANSSIQPITAKKTRICVPTSK